MTDRVRRMALGALVAAFPTIAFAGSDSAVTGAAGGAATGAIVGGPVGAAVGGTAGAVVGGAAGNNDDRTVVVQPNSGCQTTTTHREDDVGNSTTKESSNCP